MENIITVPSGWNEVSVGLYQEIAGLDHAEGTTSEVELISILANKDPEDIKKIQASNLDSILEAIKWVANPPSNEFKTEIEISGVKYYLAKLSGLSTGEQIDLETYSEDINSIHKFFALLYREADEEYSVDIMLKRSEMFKEKLMIEDVFGTIVFFLSIAQSYEKIIQACSMTPTPKI